MDGLTTGDEVRFYTSPDPDNRPPESYGWLQEPRTLPSEGRLQAIVNKQGHIELDLSNRNLRRIPQEVFNQLRTESLKLHSNDLQGIPSAVSNLHKLRVLDVHGNSIQSLPETLANLLHLQELDLSKNKLRGVPSMLGSFKYLKVLKLGENRFESLPHELGDLTALRHFEASGNKLWHLPYSFQNLQRLQHLNLARNSFDQCPISLCQMKALQVLDLRGNKLTNLPTDLDLLKVLQELNLASNDFEGIPHCIFNLKSLQSLDFSHNKLRVLPSRIGRLPKLRTLTVQDNSLTSIPGNLESIEYLNVSQNRVKNFSVVKMKHLVYLNASHNHLENLPLGTYNLSHLKVLKLNSNAISYLSQDIILLRKLRTLDLGNNKLTSLPQVINELDKLEIFNVKGNKIEVRHPHLFDPRYRGIPVPMIPVGFVKVPAKQKRSKPNQPKSKDQPLPNGYAGNTASVANSPKSRTVAEPNMTTPMQSTVQSPSRAPVIQVPNGHIHNFDYLQQHRLSTRSLYRQQEGTKKPNRFSKFRKSLGFRKSRKNRDADEPQPQGLMQASPDTYHGLDSRPPVALDSRPPAAPDSRPPAALDSRPPVALDSRPPVALDSRPPAALDSRPTAVPPLVQPEHGILHGAIPEALQAPTYTERQYSSMPRLIGSSVPYDQTQTYMTGNPRLEISYPLEGAFGSIGDLDLQALHERDSREQVTAAKRAYTDDWVTSRQVDQGSTDSREVTVNDSVGDCLSLGEEDYDYQPTTVKDHRLLGVCSEVETMLNHQLLQPIVSNRGIFKKSLINGTGTLRTLNSMPNISDINDLSNATPSHHATWGTTFTFDPDSDPDNRAPPGGIYRAKPDIFQVTPNGGLFRSSIDTNISLYFPKHSLDVPITVTMQVEKINPETLLEARKHIPRVQNLLAIGHVVYLTQSKAMDFNAQVTLTIPAPPVEHTGRLHLLTYLEDDVCVPCTAQYRQHQGYITLQTWHFSGKGAVLTKSKSSYKACKSMEAFLQHLYI